MATVRLQRRIHRPPRHRLRAAGNGRGTRGDALPGPRPKRHRVPGPRDATSLARPPGARKPAASPRTSVAPHTSSATKVSPRGAKGQKPLPKLARTSRGPARTAPPPAASPSAGGARTGTCSSLFSVQPGAAYVQHQDVGLFPRARHLTIPPGRAPDPAPRESGAQPSPRLPAHFIKVLPCP